MAELGVIASAALRIGCSVPPFALATDGIIGSNNAQYIIW